MPAEPIAALSLTRHRSLHENVSYLRSAGAALRGAPGVRFARAMIMVGGPGGVAFPLIRGRCSALIGAWDDEPAMERSLAGPAFARWRESATESLVLRLRTTRSKGSWDGCNPFAAVPSENRDPGPLAVFTRVGVRYRRAPAFYVGALPSIAVQTERNEAMLLSAGMTDRPVHSAATFSLWRSLADMQRFGYHDAPHGIVQRRARERRWFDETLFVRFRVVSAEGSWRGADVGEQLAALPRD